jgi:hypothetical protein
MKNMKNIKTIKIWENYKYKIESHFITNNSICLALNSFWKDVFSKFDDTKVYL